MNKSPFATYLLSGALSFILLACAGEENEVEKPKENQDPIVALVFSAQNPPISIPAALQSSENDHAVAINGFLRQANGITSYASYFNVPADAEVSNVPVEGSENARTSFNNEVTVYTWTYNDGSQFVTTAYQLTESDGDYFYEIFFDFGGEDGYIKALEGRESVVAVMNGELAFKGFTESDLEINYQWSESETEALLFKIFNFNSTIEINVNADNSGALTILSQGLKNAEYTWNSAGMAGTFAIYDAQGNLIGSGDWSS